MSLNELQIGAVLNLNKYGLFLQNNELQHCKLPYIDFYYNDDKNDLKLKQQNYKAATYLNELI